MPTPRKKSPSNVIDDPTQSLQKFDLLDLEPYTQEKAYAANASRDFHLFYVGRDDVHNILKHVLSRVSVSLYLNMFGYDDDELNEILMHIVHDDTILTIITLDQSQAGGKHERRLLASNAAKDPAAFNTHIVSGTQMQSFIIGQSATHRISHTKGFVADGRVGAEGSTNWSDDGEGTFIKGGPGTPGYKAQNNTQSVFTDSDTVSRFSAELLREHMIAQSQGATAKVIAAARAAAAETTPAKPAKGTGTKGHPTR